MAGIAASEADVVALLMRRHGDIRNLFDEVEQTTGDERRDAFLRLVRLLAVHKTAEEEVVHTFTRKSVTGGEEVVKDRLAEEKEAKETLARLDGAGTGDPKFLSELAALRTEVMAHARAEERYEFIHIRRTADPERLASFAGGIRAAGPWHPLTSTRAPSPQRRTSGSGPAPR
ncbi:hemerythrin superfamily protein [Streptomyces sp. V4I2]|nr:hemerythrin superfamily protein [Streptomyces sp. V4I2]